MGKSTTEGRAAKAPRTKRRTRGAGSPVRTPEPGAVSPAEGLDLAELLARTFGHPELPEELWQAISDAVCEIDGSFEKYYAPSVMREVLAVHARRKAAGEGGEGDD